MPKPTPFAEEDHEWWKASELTMMSAECEDFNSNGTLLAWHKCNPGY